MHQKLFQRETRRFPPCRPSHQDGFTLIEVLVSVVILSMVCTAVLWSLQSVQMGTLATSQYNQALGFATTIGEEIKDGYSDTTTGFTIQVPGNALGTGQSDVPVMIPAASPGGAVPTSGYTPLYGGYGYRISAAMSSGSTTDAAFVVQVKAPSGRIAIVNIPTHTLSVGGSG